MLLAGRRPHRLHLTQARQQTAPYHAAGWFGRQPDLPEGTGSLHYEDWMRGKGSYADIIQDFQDEGFRIGPHKAFQIARDASKFRLMSYTSMDNTLAKALLLNPINDLQTAIDFVLAELKPITDVGVLPHAASTIPYVRSP